MATDSPDQALASEESSAAGVQSLTGTSLIAMAADSTNQALSSSAAGARRGLTGICRRRYWCRGGLLVAVALAIGLVVYLLEGAAESGGLPTLGFSPERAVKFATLAGAAYCSRISLEAWNCGEKCISGMQRPVRVCQGTTTQAFVGIWEGRAVVSFEGTEYISSMLQDLRTWRESTPWDTCEGCLVHTGFLEEWRSHRDCVKSSLRAAGAPEGSRIAVVGHSLGGAVSALAAVGLHNAGWRVVETYSFGMPRVGDRRFSEVFHELFGGPGTTAVRVTHHMDPVPHVPPQEFGFLHVAPEYFFDGDGANAPYTKCTSPEDARCAEQYWDVLHDAFHVNDHRDYMGVNTGIAGCAGPAAEALPQGGHDGNATEPSAEVQQPGGHDGNATTEIHV